MGEILSHNTAFVRTKCLVSNFDHEQVRTQRHGPHELVSEGKNGGVADDRFSPPQNTPQGPRIKAKETPRLAPLTALQRLNLARFVGRVKSLPSHISRDQDACAALGRLGLAGKMEYSALGTVEATDGGGAGLYYSSEEREGREPDGVRFDRERARRLWEAVSGAQPVGREEVEHMIQKNQCLFTNTQCKVCCALLISESQKLAHYQSKKHANKVKRYLAIHGMETLKGETKKLDSEQVSKSNGIIPGPDSSVWTTCSERLNNLRRLEGFLPSTPSWTGCEPASCTCGQPWLPLLSFTRRVHRPETGLGCRQPVVGQSNCSHQPPQFAPTPVPPWCGPL
ncbi:zinc finger protein 346 isoform X7 [Tamandua tetradactyla]|uniref:zinc finger protein 346 isoform X7 n=1 Tax=Tamandua tetradactyla TaxID=48850 RepID=UPI00405475B2